MTMRRINLVVMAVLLAALMVIPAAALESDAAYTGHDSQKDLTVRTLDIYEAEFTSTGKIYRVDSLDNNFRDVAVFISGSVNEQAFLTYVKDGTGQMPADDMATEAAGDVIHMYMGVSSPSWYNYGTGYEQNPETIGVRAFIVDSSVIIEATAKLTFAHTQLPIYRSHDCYPTASAVYDTEHYQVYLDYTLLTAEPQERLTAYGDFCLLMTQPWASPSFDYLNATLSYEVSNYWEPSSQGNGGMICAVILLVLSLAILAYVVVLRRGPKWAQ